MTVKVMVLALGIAGAGAGTAAVCWTDSASAGCGTAAGDNGLPRSGSAPNKITNPKSMPESVPATIGMTIPRRCFLGVGFKGLVRSSAFINRAKARISISA
jgi:hypothetical protein